MTALNELAASRPLGVAAEVGSTLDAACVFAKRVVLTGEIDVLSTQNGKWMFMDCLRLLPRLVGDLDVVLPDAVPGLQIEVDDTLHTLWTQGHVRRIDLQTVDLEQCDAVLNVGAGVAPGLPWTSILANGWVARCTSGVDPLSVGCEQSNPVSCMLAASLGVAEVFKRVYGVPCERIEPMIDSSFSLFEMSTEFDNIGPPLPAHISIPEALLLGAGAIGNALTLLLSQLPLSGQVFVLDKQLFEGENRGTCVLLDSESWVGTPKAERLSEWLAAHSHLACRGRQSTIENAVSNGALAGERFELVLNGLDDIDARRAVQRLWPTLLIDGALNSVGASVVTHSARHPEYACLRCVFKRQEENAQKIQQKITGLATASLDGSLNRPISDTDILEAEPAFRAWLKSQQEKGKTICSTITDAHEEMLGVELAEGFRPSVPFVATASAALVAAQMLRTILAPEQPFVHEFQFGSVFAGVHTGARLTRHADANCDCVIHRSAIATLIKKRLTPMVG